MNSVAALRESVHKCRPDRTVAADNKHSHGMDQSR
jgi:hypothetical protein